MHEDTFFFSDNALKITFSSKIYCKLDLLLHQHVSEFIIATKHAFLIISFNIFSLFYFIWKTCNHGHKFWGKYQILTPPPFLYSMIWGPFGSQAQFFFLCNIEKKNPNKFLLDFVSIYLVHDCLIFFYFLFLKKSKIVSIGNILENWLKTGLQ